MSKNGDGRVDGRRSSSQTLLREEARDGDAILIVDDNPTNLKLVAYLVRANGYDGRHRGRRRRRAMAAIAAHKPRLILMDLQLPGIDGLELTRRLKADPATARHHDRRGHRVRDEGRPGQALAAGCDDYVTKPIDTRALARADREAPRATAPA